MSGSLHNGSLLASERRMDGDRREQSCRRRGQDGAGSRIGNAEGREAVRPYTFRSFSDRRQRDDRRFVVGSNGRRATDRQQQTHHFQDADYVDLSAEEILALMHDPEK